VISRARAALKSGAVSTTALAVEGRSTLGQFMPGPREQPKMDRARAALLDHPHLSATAIARMIGVSKKTVLNVKNNNPDRRRLGNTVPLSAAPVLRVGGRFVAGVSRRTVEAERAEDAVLKHPGMPVRALAKLTGMPRTTLRRATERLNKSAVSAETPVDEPLPVVAGLWDAETARLKREGS
jgi:hypothetical protein